MPRKRVSKKILEEFVGVVVRRVRVWSVAVATLVVAAAKLQTMNSRSARFAECAVKPYIPRICRYFLDFLAIKREPDQLRTQPFSFATEKRKRSVVIAAAHTDAIKVSVNCDAWSDDDVEFGGIDFVAVHGFEEAEIRPNERRFAQYAQKSESAVAVDDRRVNGFPHGPRTIEDHAGIDFIGHRDVAGYAA